MNAFIDSPNPTLLNHAVTILDRWAMGASADGDLWIQARRSPVGFAECCDMLRRLGQTIGTGRMNTVVLDLGRAGIADEHWPAIIRLVTRVANKMKAGFRVIASSKCNEAADPREMRHLLRNVSGAPVHVPLASDAAPVRIVWERFSHASAATRFSE